jgi:hypothetical protein
MAIQTDSPIIPSDFVGDPAPFLSIETTDGTTHSLTTVANQKVIVFVNGQSDFGATSRTISVSYNGTAKQTLTVNSSSTPDEFPFQLMYVDTPGAGTQNITVTSPGAIRDVRIVVIKLLIG